MVCLPVCLFALFLLEKGTKPTRLRYLGHDGFGGFIRGREYTLALGGEETYGELFPTLVRHNNVFTIK